MVKKVKYYVVWKGRKSGLFTSWEECEAQVKGFPDAQYKAFGNLAAAERAQKRDYQDFAGQPISTSGEWLFVPDPPIAESYAVDAACSGSPGSLEFQCVYLGTGGLIFREGPYKNGTNNIGEFLAIVHTLIKLDKEGIDAPVYSDSETAISWVKSRKCKTTLEPDGINFPLFQLIGRAENWLSDHEYPNRLLKWDTNAWGEIPADFNRK
jgi:ribonuclease HI